MAPSAGAQQKIAVPSYFYPSSPVPSGLWQQLESGVPTVGLAIINPNSGPGTSPDASYQQIVSTKPSGLKILGYVHTSYGSRSLSTVESEVNSYYTWYPGIDGIFVDEADNTSCTTESSYYLPLYNFVKGKSASATVVINPGTSTLECYVNAADIIITFESTYSSYSGTWSTAHSWEASYPAAKFWHLVHTTSSTQMANALSLSRQRNAGWVYVTDDALPNPWDSLAGYWSSEVSNVSQSGAPITSYSAQSDSTFTTYAATFNSAFSFHHVFIDTDVNAATGYTGVTGIGADYMIENGKLYRSNVNGNTWSWTDLGAITATSPDGNPSSTVTGPRTWQVARSTIGETGSGNTSRMVFHGSGTSPDYSAPVYSHTTP